MEPPKAVHGARMARRGCPLPGLGCLGEVSGHGAAEVKSIALVEIALCLGRLLRRSLAGTLLRFGCQGGHRYGGLTLLQLGDSQPRKIGIIGVLVPRNEQLEHRNAVRILGPVQASAASLNCHAFGLWLPACCAMSK